MKIRMAVLALVLAVASPVAADAAQGILLLAHAGRPEWNAQVTQLAAEVDKRKPAEAAIGLANRDAIQAAVDRLKKRGVTEIVAVPFFISQKSPVLADAKYFEGLAVPVRLAAPPNADPVLFDIALSRIGENTSPGAIDVIILGGVGTSDSADVGTTAMDLSAAAQQLNRSRRFGPIVVLSKIDAQPSAQGQEQTRRSVERATAKGGRVVVVPVTAFDGLDKQVEIWLLGAPHELAKSAVLPDARLVDWVLSRASAQ